MSALDGINWSEGAQPQAAMAPPVIAAQQGALAGYELGQQGAMVHALQGINLSDPASVNAGMTALVHSNALDKANAVLNLSRAQWFQDFARQKMANSASQQNGAPPNQAPASGSPSATPTVSISGQEVDPTAAAAHTAKIDAAIDQVSSLPYGQRAAAIAQLAPTLGIDPQSAAGFDPTDANMSSLKQHNDAYSAHIAGNIPNAPPDIYTPSDLQIMSLMSGDPAKMAQAYTIAHPDMVGVPGLPGVVMNPRTGATMRLASPEEMAATAGTIAQATQGGTNAANIAQGPALNLVHAQGVGMETAARNQADLATAEARAQAAASGAYKGDVHEYDYTNPATGETSKVTLLGSDYLALQKSIPGLGVGQSDQSKHFQIADQDNFQTAANLASDVGREARHQSAATLGQQIIGLSNQVGTGKYTPAISNLAQSIAPLLPPGSNLSNYANNSTLLAQDLTAGVKSVLQGMPAIKSQSEFNTVVGAVPHNGSPQDNIRLAGAQLTAANNYEAKYDQFISDWAADPTKPHSKIAMDNAWRNGPGAVSYLADPVFLGQTYNGRPMVQISPKPLKDGHIWGIFMPSPTGGPNGGPGGIPFLVK